MLILRSVLMCFRAVVLMGVRQQGRKTTTEDFEIAFDSAE